MSSFKKNKKSIVLVKPEKATEESPPAAGIPPASPPSSTDVMPTGELASVERAPSRYKVTGQICKTLGETATSVIGQIRRIVEKLGIDESFALLAETQALEASGGMMLPDGSRRRTPGGVFFKLVKTKYPDLFPMWTAQREAETRRRTEKEKRAEAGLPAVKPASLPALNVDIPLDPEQKGTKVKLTLIGRPTSRIADHSTYVTFVMQSQKVPTLPKGLPTPDEGKTNYLVYVVSKQWRKVAEALRDPEDFLIIEGFPQLNSQNNSITVFATNTTTKNLQRAAKEMQRVQAENKEPQP